MSTPSSDQASRLDYIDRSNWPRGPWDDEPDRIYFVDAVTGYPCLMRRNGGGAWCGYVGITEAHPEFKRWGLSYDSYCVDVHGGLTYADPCTGDPHTGICHVAAPGQPDHVIWLGFDCAHSGDLCPGYSHLMGENYQTMEWVRSEVLSLAKQLKAQDDT